MSRPARVMLLGMVLALAAVALHLWLDWSEVLAVHAHWLRPLRLAMSTMLPVSWYWAFAVPALLMLVSVVRFVRAKSGRAAIAWKLFAFVTLWAIGSAAFFVGLFLAYVPEMGEGGTGLLVPGLVACVGYLVIGLGFVLSVARD
ncbi:MAG TPA: hypothetical protein VEC19_07135 [Usitatibacter sp.]|nr:hypothetical protein [Usitatibacter sp.]